MVGYDDSPLIAFTDPPLTTVRQPVPAMAVAAVRALLDEINGHARPAHRVRVPPGTGRARLHRRYAAVPGRQTRDHRPPLTASNLGSRRLLPPLAAGLLP